jgi:hypothetical protein
MRDIRKEMTYKMPYTLFWLGILLPAMRAIPLSNNSSAVKTGLVMTKMMTAQGFFLKIAKKGLPSLTLPQLRLLSDSYPYQNRTLYCIPNV